MFSGKNYTTDKNFTRPSLQISTMDASIYWLYCSHSNEGSKLVGPHFLTKCKIVQQTIIILEEGGESPQERLEDHSTISIDIRKGRRGYLPQDEGATATSTTTTTIPTRLCHKMSKGWLLMKPLQGGATPSLPPTSYCHCPSYHKGRPARKWCTAHKLQ